MAACALMLAVAAVAGGCGSRTITTKLAQDAIVGAHEDTLADKDLQVVSIVQLGPGDAVAETQLHTAFRLQKVDNQWVVREVRVGRGEWEKLDDILRALEQFKIDETRRIFDAIFSALDTYTRKNGHLPQFRNYIELSDALFPLYLPHLVREDPWKRPLAAMQTGPGEICITSAGADGKPGTADDIERSRTFSK
jgi:hypothetical protein